MEKASKALGEYIQSLQNPSIAEANLFGMGAVGELEAMFKSYYGVEYALCFSSATNALTAISLVLELGDSEVITSPFNYGGSLGGLDLVNAQLKFTDTNDYLSINPTSIESLITNKSKAVWSVDYGGYPVNQSEIRAICDKYGLWFISDAAQSLGALSNGLPASSLADVWVTSMTYGKTLYTGEGAVILTNNKTIYQKLLSYIHPNRVRLEVSLDDYTEIVPINGRINPLAAVMGKAIFSDALDSLKTYQNACFELLESLKHQKEISLPQIPKSDLPSFFYIFGYINDLANIHAINQRLKADELPFYAQPLNLSSLSLNHPAPTNLLNFQYQSL